MKQIKLNHIVPNPIKEFGFSHSMIWNNQFTFNKGEFYQIVAPSGIGKSTLINIIYGDRIDFDGELFFDEISTKRLKQKDWNEIRRTKISYVFQGLHLFEELTLLENIQLKNGLTKHVDETQIKKWVEIVGLGKHLNQKSVHLSYGQRQRIAVIRAFCQPFDFILLDEPFSHLDDENQNLLMDLIENEANKNNAGVIFTSLQPIQDQRIHHVVQL